MSLMILEKEIRSIEMKEINRSSDVSIFPLTSIEPVTPYAEHLGTLGHLGVKRGRRSQVLRLDERPLCICMVGGRLRRLASATKVVSVVSVILDDVSMPGCELQRVTHPSPATTSSAVLTAQS